MFLNDGAALRSSLLETMLPGARCISFSGNYVACAARRRIKRPPEGRVRSPANGKYGKMLRCYAERNAGRPFAREKRKQWDRQTGGGMCVCVREREKSSSFAFVLNRMRREHDGNGEPDGISISCNEN